MGFVKNETMLAARRTARNTEDIVRLAQGRPTVSEERAAQARGVALVVITILIVFPSLLVIALAKAVPWAARGAVAFYHSREA